MKRLPPPPKESVHTHAGARTRTFASRHLYERSSSSGDDVPLGYEFVYSEAADFLARRQKWLLPTSLLDQLERERLLEEDDESDLSFRDGTDAHEAKDSDTEDAARVDRPKVSADDGSTSPCSPAPAAPALPPLPPAFQGRGSVGVKVIEQAEIDRLAQVIKSGDKQRDNRIQEIRQRLMGHGPWRHRLYPLCQQPISAAHAYGIEHEGDNGLDGAEGISSASPQATIEACFAPLYRAHPHFREVVDLYRDCAVAAVNPTGPPSVMSPPPILLLGAPGLGKTHFAKALAEVLGLPILALAFDAGLTNAALLGSDRHWGNTHHGALFEHLCLGTVANPMVLLDEIDKAPVNRESHQSPLVALHSCLEPVSAVQVRDISVDVSFNASHVLWLATANDARSIPATVLSRFTIFHVLPPVGEDAYWLTLTLCKAVLASDGRGIALPSGDMRAALSVFSPRQQRSCLQSACQRARAAGRLELRAEDFPKEVRQEMTVDKPPANVSSAKHKHTSEQSWLH